MMVRGCLASTEPGELEGVFLSWSKNVINKNTSIHFSTVNLANMDLGENSSRCICLKRWILYNNR